MQFDQPTPELPVPDVVAAQAYYRDKLGFEIKWHNTDGAIGAVAHGKCAIFFREQPAPHATGVFWFYADDIDVAFADLQRRGAQITDPLSDKPWGMRQFTVRDHLGNTFYFHHDL